MFINQGSNRQSTLFALCSYVCDYSGEYRYMDEIHLKNLENEMRGINVPRLALEEKLKRTYYILERSIMGALLRRKLSKNLKDSPIFNAVDRLLFNEGGMFKRYAYGLSARIRPIKGSLVLVPGVGYGRHLYQLASFRPKHIVAFDPITHKEEWKFLRSRIEKKFGIEVEFIHGGYEKLSQEYIGRFDHIISDAVLAHVSDLRNFMNQSAIFLKEGGVFYASYGPIWYGPNGDYSSRPGDKAFDHLLLSKEDYKKQLADMFTEISDDPCQASFISTKEMHSYLKAEEYLEILKETGFVKKLLFAKISTSAMHFLYDNPEVDKILDKKGVPKLDRLCSGFFLWAVKK